jgi:GntR family transcriptional regulator
MTLSMAAEHSRAGPGTSRRPDAKHVDRVPKYKQVRDELMRAIVAGEYPPGSCLPSEHELVRRFGVSRVTVRMALDLLRDINLVYGHQGKGHVVRNLQAIQDLGRLQGFGEIMASLGVATRSKVLSTTRVEAPPEVAQSIRLDRDAQVVKIERLRIAAGVTMSMDVSYFPLAIGEPLLDLDLANVDIFRLIETALGIEIGFADIVMDVIEPRGIVRKQLGLGAGEKVIRIERLTYDTRCRPIDFEYLYGRAEAHQFKLRVARW